LIDEAYRNPLFGKAGLMNKPFMTRCFLAGLMVIVGTYFGEALPNRSDAEEKPLCDPDNGGIVLPDGFCSMVVADNLGRGRHVEVASNGDIYVSLRDRPDSLGAVIALRDADGDGRAEVRERFGDGGGTGLVLHNGYLYLARTSSIVRFPMREGELLPIGPSETLITLPTQRSHADKGLAFDDAGALYVNVGAPSNACQEPDREVSVPGQNPCPLLERHGGIWRFDGSRSGQTQDNGGVLYATGMRQMIALAWHRSGELYLVQHGRDQLNTLWPDQFTDEQNAELPSEEFQRVLENSDFGWPYCHHDWQQNKRVQSPEYGGNGTEVGQCAQYPPPIMGFPGHWAPNDLIFYSGDQFPERYRGGAFIAFHGSWNRAPLPQGGYNVTFVPFGEIEPSGDYEIFADGFAGQKPLMERSSATYRPTGLAEGPDGSLYISDSVNGRLWRVMYRDFPSSN
jgi:glucose/arabinose dehydrogenase